MPGWVGPHLVERGSRRRSRRRPNETRPTASGLRWRASTSAPFWCRAPPGSVGPWQRRSTVPMGIRGDGSGVAWVWRSGRPRPGSSDRSIPALVPPWSCRYRARHGGRGTGASTTPGCLPWRWPGRSAACVVAGWPVVGGLPRHPCQDRFVGPPGRGSCRDHAGAGHAWEVGVGHAWMLEPRWYWWTTSSPRG